MHRYEEDRKDPLQFRIDSTVSSACYCTQYMGKVLSTRTTTVLEYDSGVWARWAMGRCQFVSFILKVIRPLYTTVGQADERSTVLLAPTADSVYTTVKYQTQEVAEFCLFKEDFGRKQMRS